MSQPKVDNPTRADWADISNGHANKFNGRSAWIIRSFDRNRQPEEVISFMSFDDVTFPTQVKTWSYLKNSYATQSNEYQLAPKLSITYQKGIYRKISVKIVKFP